MPETTEGVPRLSKEVLFESMRGAAATSLDAKEKELLSNEIIEKFLNMLYDSSFTDRPEETYNRILEFIVTNSKK